MKKVLVACDDKILRLLYKEELIEEGYDIAATGRVTKLIEKIDEEKPDLVLVDCRMDRYMNSDLRQAVLNRSCRAPVILCTDHQPPLTENLDGVPCVVPRSSNFSHLKGTIQKALGKNSLFPHIVVHDPKTETPLEQIRLRFSEWRG